MKNKLTDLNDYLFETLENLMDNDLSEEQMEREISRAAAVCKVAEVVVKNGELALKTMQHLNEMGYGTDKQNKSLAPVPKMLEVGK